MKIILYLFSVLFLVSCESSVVKEDTGIHNTSSNNFSNNTLKEEPFLDTVIKNNNLSFHIKAENIDSSLVLLSATSETVTFVIDTIDRKGLYYVKFIDFDHNGNSDILIDYIGNNSTYSLYLFDSVKNSFRNIEDYARFPDAIQLKSNNNYYYSYHRAGCADMNWVSDLFKIENFKIVHVGHIYGQGCDFEIEENPQSIKAYKITDSTEENNILIESLSFTKYIHQNSDKWDFIEKYWNKNYSKFE